VCLKHSSTDGTKVCYTNVQTKATLVTFKFDPARLSAHAIMYHKNCSIVAARRYRNFSLTRPSQYKQRTVAQIYELINCHSLLHVSKVTL